jgi:hypothetical protein
MAADETDPLYEPGRRKRSRSGRTPPVIEGEVAAPAPASAPEPEPAPAVEPQAAEPAPVAASAPGPLQHLPLAVGVVMGALGLGAGLYGAYQAQSAAGEIMDLRTEVAGLRARGPAAAPSPDQLVALERRIAALEQRPSSPRTAEPVAAAVANPPELRTLSDRVAAADAAAKAAGESARAALQTANRAAEASARPLPPPVDLQPLDKRLAALEGREAPLAAMARRTEAAGLAIVAQSIAHALDQGAPFESALAAAASLGADAGKLATLQTLAKSGAPTARSLARLWTDESRAALDAALPPQGDQGWLDRLKAGASRVVRVRPVGETSGEDPAALGARIDAALARGALAEALAAWTKLPEPARAASRIFGETARQSIAAGEAAQALASSAVADLARSKGAP